MRNGVAELAGFRPDLLAAFSTRTGEVEAEYRQLAADGLTPGAAHAAAQRGSRTPKKVLADAEVRAAQHRRLAEAGWTASDVRTLGAPTGHRPRPPEGREIAGLLDELARRPG